MLLPRLSWVLVLPIFLASPALAAAVFDEATLGDFSNDGLAPTSLDLGPGSNQLFGTTGRGTTTDVDRDYVTFVVPTGYVWSAIVELSGTQSGGSMSFIGVEAGNQVTVSPTGFSAAGLLGWTHYSPALASTDLLPSIGTGDLGSTGFVPPLPAGTYAIWIQDFNAGTYAYGFDIQIAPAPEPGSLALVLAGLVIPVGIHNLRRRSRRTISG